MKKIFLLFAIGMVFTGCSDSDSNNGGGQPFNLIPLKENWIMRAFPLLALWYAWMTITTD